MACLLWTDGIFKVCSFLIQSILQLTTRNSFRNSGFLTGIITGKTINCCSLQINFKRYHVYTGLIISLIMASNNTLTLEKVKELLLDRPPNKSQGTKKKAPPVFGVQVPLFYGRENIQMNNFDQVYPSIYLGNVEISRDKETLRQINATHILNAAQGTKFNQINTDENYYSDLNVKFLGFPAVDIFTYKIAKHFTDAAEFMDKCLNENGVIVVFCQQGLSRSASLILAFLMIKRGMTLTQAINTVKAKRPIFPNEGFLKQLIELNYELYGGV